MKYRKDFVTNSSSSSFVCEICGTVETGYDLPLQDAGMVVCINDHTFCKEHMLPYDPKVSREEMIDELQNTWLRNRYSVDEMKALSDEELVDHYFEYVASEDQGGWGVPEEVCPICQFIEYSEADLANYLEKDYGVDREEVFASIKAVNRRRKKLYDSEYITYVCKKFDLEPAGIVAGWKERFGNYEGFKKYLKNNS